MSLGLISNHFSTSNLSCLDAVTLRRTRKSNYIPTPPPINEGLVGFGGWRGCDRLLRLCQRVRPARLNWRRQRGLNLDTGDCRCQRAVLIVCHSPKLTTWICIDQRHSSFQRTRSWLQIRSIFMPGRSTIRQQLASKFGLTADAIRFVRHPAATYGRASSWPATRCHSASGWATGTIQSSDSSGSPGIKDIATD